MIVKVGAVTGMFQFSGPAVGSWSIPPPLSPPRTVCLRKMDQRDICPDASLLRLSARLSAAAQEEGWCLWPDKTRRHLSRMGLQLHNKTPKRRVKAKLRDDRRVAARPNETWAMDFVHDQLATGTKLGVLTIVDTFSPASRRRRSHASPSTAQMSLRYWKEFGPAMGLPASICVDRGTEFVSCDLDLWAYRHGITLDFSRPGKSTDNSFIEAFNGRFPRRMPERALVPEQN